MKIGGNFPVVPQGNTNHRPQNTLPVAAHDASEQGFQAPSSIAAFEQTASSSSSARFFKTEGLSAFAQQALSAYQSTESLSSNNPRNHLVGVDVYA